MDCSPPGSSVQGIPQARIVEWIAMPSSRGFSQPRDRTHVSLCFLHWQAGSLPLELPGKPITYLHVYQGQLLKILPPTPDSQLPWSPSWKQP